ncbi:MAG: hypothetical protein AAF614_44525 [Chloroflexota bacterium]
MSTEDFIIESFCRVDDQMLDVKKHSQACLYPSQVVTLALLFALKGHKNRHRESCRDYWSLLAYCPHPSTQKIQKQ